MDLAARLPSATAVMMMRGPNATSPPANTSGREVARVTGSVCNVPRGVSFRLSSGRIQERSAAWPMASTTVSQSTVSSLPVDELRIEAAVLVKYAAGLDQLDAGDLAIAPENAFRTEAGVQSDAFVFRLFDFLTRRRDFVEVFQAIHVDFRHAFADGFARHIEREAHFVGRFGLAGGQLFQRGSGLMQGHAQFRLAHAGELLGLAHHRARDVEGDVAAADDHDLAAERDAKPEVDVEQKLDRAQHAVELHAFDGQLAALVRADAEEDRLEALLLQIGEGEVRPSWELSRISTPSDSMASISAWMISRGRRYSGTPSTNMPPATLCASNTVGAKPHQGQFVRAGQARPGRRR